MNPSASCALLTGRTRSSPTRCSSNGSATCTWFGSSGDNNSITSVGITTSSASPSRATWAPSAQWACVRRRTHFAQDWGRARLFLPNEGFGGGGVVAKESLPMRLSYEDSCKVLQREGYLYTHPVILPV